VFLGTGAASFIDLVAADRLGIRVRTYGGYGDQSVAEHALALMFAAGRGIARMDREIRAGRFEPVNGIEFAGKSLGVLGTGGIGRAMVRLGAGLGMRVLAWNRSGVPDDLPAQAIELDDLLAQADVLSIHLTLNEGTRNFIDRRRLGLLKPGAILINTARGAIVDEAALIEALRDGRIAHARPRRVHHRAAAGRASARRPAERHAHGARRIRHARGIRAAAAHCARNPGRGA
jgi:D-3-phosphoglycerate dehydrogenase